MAYFCGLYISSDALTPESIWYDLFGLKILTKKEKKNARVGPDYPPLCSTAQKASGSVVKEMGHRCSNGSLLWCHRERGICNCLNSAFCPQFMLSTISVAQDCTRANFRVGKQVVPSFAKIKNTLHKFMQDTIVISRSCSGSHYQPFKPAWSESKIALN